MLNRAIITAVFAVLVLGMGSADSFATSVDSVNVGVVWRDPDTGKKLTATANGKQIKEMQALCDAGMEVVEAIQTVMVNTQREQAIAKQAAKRTGSVPPKGS
jgi:hypothetical protein